MSLRKIAFASFMGSTPQPSDFDIVFLFDTGQSNANNRAVMTGNVPPEQLGPMTGVKIWNSINGIDNFFSAYESGVSDCYGLDPTLNGEIAIMSNIPDHFAMSASLAYKLYNTYSKPVYVTRVAVGGIGIDASLPGNVHWDATLSGNLYEYARDTFIEAATKCIAENPGMRIKFIWKWTGMETDCLTELSSSHAETNFTTLVNTMRSDIADAFPAVEDLQVMDMMVTSLRSDIDYDFVEPVQRAIVNVATTLPKIYWHDMETARTPLSSDITHYSPGDDINVGYDNGFINAGEDLADAINLIYDNGVVETDYAQILGGTKIVSGDYYYIKFNYPAAPRVLSIGVSGVYDDVLLVGAGASGGGASGVDGGGAGGGRVKTLVNKTMLLGNQKIIPGRGGVTDPFVNPKGRGTNGEATVFNDEIANGGGAGGGFDEEVNGLNGGNSGGGGSFTAGAPGIGEQYNGGSGSTYPGSAGGGGGAGGNGQNGTLTKAGDGGIGYLWRDGVRYAYGGGGGANSSAITPSIGRSSTIGNGQVRGVSAANNGADGFGDGGGGIANVGDPGPKARGGHGTVKLYVKFQN